MQLTKFLDKVSNSFKITKENKVFVKTIYEKDYSKIDREYISSKYFLNNLINKKWLNVCRFNVYIPFSNTNVIVEIHTLKSDNIKDLKQTISNYLLFMSIVMKNVFNKHLPDFYLILYMSRINKTLPKHLSKETILSKHINSGMTVYSGMTVVNSGMTGFKPQIIIYRKQELLKVLTHEIIHLCGNHPHSYEQVYDYKIKEMFNIQNTNSLNVYESYVETLALLINCVVYSNLNKRNNILTNLEMEKKHSQSIVNQVYLQLNNGSKVVKFQEPLKEETNFFSYIVIKCFFLQNLELFFSLIDNETFVINDSYKFLNGIINNLCKLKIDRNFKNNGELFRKFKFCCLEI
jgi:hypothetical protein